MRVLGLLHLLSAAPEAPTGPEFAPIGFEWDAPAECPSAERVTALVAERARAPLHGGDARRLDVIARVRREADERWALRMWFITDEGTKTRDLADASCALLADAAATLIAAKLEPDRVEAEVVAASEPGPTDDEAVKAAYLAERIEIDSYLFGLLFQARHGDGRPLHGRSFYELLERPDLARRFRRRRAGKIGLLVASPLAMAGGLATAVAVPLQTSGDESRNLAVGLGVGIPLAVLGMAGTVAGALMRSHPVDVSAASELAHGFNERLKRRMGIRSNVDVGATVHRHGVGIILMRHF